VSRSRKFKLTQLPVRQFRWHDCTLRATLRPRETRGWYSGTGYPRGRICTVYQHPNGKA